MHSSSNQGNHSWVAPGASTQRPPALNRSATWQEYSGRTGGGEGYRPFDFARGTLRKMNSRREAQKDNKAQQLARYSADGEDPSTPQDFDDQRSTGVSQASGVSTGDRSTGTSQVSGTSFRERSLSRSSSKAELATARFFAAQDEFAADGEQDLGARCLRGHVLTEWETKLGGMYKCDLCGKAQPKGNTLNGCRKCGFDVCKDCLVHPSQRPEPPAESMTPRRSLSLSSFRERSLSRSLSRSSSRAELAAARVATAHEEFHAAQEDGAEIMCPKGHALVEWTPKLGGMFTCNICGKGGPKGFSFHGCRKCGFDLCKDCMKPPVRAVEVASERPRAPEVPPRDLLAWMDKEHHKLELSKPASLSLALATLALEALVRGRVFKAAVFAIPAWALASMRRPTDAMVLKSIGTDILSATGQQEALMAGKLDGLAVLLSALALRAMINNSRDTGTIANFILPAAAVAAIPRHVEVESALRHLKTDKGQVQAVVFALGALAFRALVGQRNMKNVSAAVAFGLSAVQLAKQESLV